MKRCTKQQRQSASDFLRGLLVAHPMPYVAKMLSTTHKSVNQVKNMTLRSDDPTKYCAPHYLILRLIEWRDNA